MSGRGWWREQLCGEGVGGGVVVVGVWEFVGGAVVMVGVVGGGGGGEDAREKKTGREIEGPLRVLQCARAPSGKHDEAASPWHPILWRPSHRLCMAFSWTRRRREPTASSLSRHRYIATQPEELRASAVFCPVMESNFAWHRFSPECTRIIDLNDWLGRQWESVYEMWIGAIPRDMGLPGALSDARIQKGRIGKGPEQHPIAATPYRSPDPQ